MGKRTFANAINRRSFFRTVIVSRAGLTNLVHDPMALQTIRIADLQGA
jgi:hypothetical protein